MKVVQRAVLAGTVAMLGLAAAPAHAGTGCNHVVNIFVWGCAPWDNNNGQQFPYYKKRVVAIPKKDAKVVTKQGSSAVLYNGTYYPLVQPNASGVISNDGGSFSVYSSN